MNLQITDRAASKISDTLTSMGKPTDQWGLRLGVMGGGCSGMRYVMEFDIEQPQDQVSVNGDAKVFIDPKSAQFVSGSLDYTESIMESGFKVVNSREAGSCGCGKSFSV